MVDVIDSDRMSHVQVHRIDTGLTYDGVHAHRQLSSHNHGILATVNKHGKRENTISQFVQTSNDGLEKE